MKKTFILSITFILLLCPKLNKAQGLYIIDRKTLDLSGDQDLNRILFNRQLPDLEVEVKEGYKFELKQFIRSNRKFKDKPTLIITTFDFCGGCMDIIKMIQKAGIAGKYNVVALYERTSESPTDGTALEKLLLKKSLGSTCPDVLFITAPSDSSGKAFLEQATPLFLFCDKDLTPIDGFITLRMSDVIHERVEQPLNWIDQGLMSRKELWYDRNMHLVRKNDPAMFFKRTLIEQGERVMISLAYKDTVVYRRNYQWKDGILYNDGPEVENQFGGDSATGYKLSKYLRATFKMGRPTSDMIVYKENGSPSAVIPFNGTMRSYDDSGNVKLEGPIVNGLGDGLFSYYEENKLKWKVTYQQGVMTGPYEGYENGILKSKGTMLKGKGVGLLKVYEKNGTLSYETYQSDLYDKVGYFKEGLAWVKKNGEYGYINKSGVEVIPIQFSEAADFENGKAKVTRNNRTYYIDTKGQ